MGIGLENLLKEVRLRAIESGCFESVALENSCLTCKALHSAEPAEYRICIEDNKLCISLVTPNRWLSESIESDLVEHGDDIVDLIDEEVRSHNYKGPQLAVLHFRSPDKFFTFRSPLPIPVHHPADVKADPANIETTFTVLMTYQNVFSELGDMQVAES